MSEFSWDGSCQLVVVYPPNSSKQKGVSKTASNLYISENKNQEQKVNKILANQHKHTYRNLSDFNFPKDFGIFPSNLLSYKSMLISDFK